MEGKKKKENPNSSFFPGFDVNVFRRAKITLSVFSPELKISVSPEITSGHHHRQVLGVQT